MTRINADTKEKAKNLGQKDEGLENQRSMQQIHFFAFRFLTFVFYARVSASSATRFLFWLRRNGGAEEFVGGSPPFARALRRRLARLEPVRVSVGDLIREGLSCRLKFVVRRAKRY
jgi:hypothetical protein